MYIGSKRSGCKQADQIDDGLKVGLVNQVSVFLERISAIGDTIEDRLRSYTVDEIFACRKIIKINRNNAFILDISQPPPLVEIDHRVDIVANGGEYLVQVGTDKTRCARDQNRAAQCAYVGLQIRHSEPPGELLAVYSMASILSTSRADCLRKKFCDPYRSK